MTTDGYVIREPLGLLEAEAWVIARLGDTPRAAHSRFVGELMRRMGERLAADEAELWEITGLLHDLDFFVVDGDWPIHGRTTAAWLEGRLPIAALLAIAAHDHRSGILSDAPLSQALRLCDALAILDEAAGRAPTVAALGEGGAALAGVAGARSYLAAMIVDLSAQLDTPLAALAAVLSGLARQARH